MGATTQAPFRIAVSVTSSECRQAVVSEKPDGGKGVIDRLQGLREHHSGAQWSVKGGR